MKKYLMSGIAALALCAAFTSCSKSDLYDEGAIQQQKETSAREAYAAAFEKAFGKVGANVDWGFGTPSNTRAGEETPVDLSTHVGAYPNANQWASRGFSVPDPLLDGQKLRVQYYFQMNKITNPNRPDYHQISFFMQQVYDGGTDPMTKYKDGDYSLEKYPAASSTPGNPNYIESGEHMDHLTCGPDHTHTFNFNNGNCSPNPNVGNNGAALDTDQHTDQIQLMLNTKTSCFGYANSDASCVRDDRWTLVSGAVIDEFCNNNGFAAWLSQWNNENGKNVEDAIVDDDWHRSFIGFDFDMLPDDLIWAGDPVDANGNIIYDLYNDGDKIDHIEYKWYELNGKKYHYLITNSNMYCGESRTIDPEPQGDAALELLNNGWLPAYNTANKTWIKVGNCADGYYSDWIVSFMPATPGEVPETYNYRVIAEDLSANDASDFDFNDVVFDIVPNGTTSANIMLIAAGGIYKLTVNGIEVHEAWGENAVDGKYPMINTGRGPKHDPIVIATLPGDYSGIDARGKIGEIEIIVYKPGYENGLELTATRGEAACKILVDSRFTVVPERQNILDEYEHFTDYVRGYWNDQAEQFWWNIDRVNN